MIRRTFPYIFLIISSMVIASYNRDTREDIKVEYGHKNVNEPYRIVLETYNNRYVCNDCDMMIKSYKNSAQAITSNGNVYLFDDVGCMIRWLDKQDFKDEVKKYVYTHDTGFYINAEYAWYVRDQATPLGYGFGAYETSMGAMNSAVTSSEIESQFGDFSSSRETTKEIYEYEQIVKFALRGETLLHPMIKRQLLKVK